MIRASRKSLFRIIGWTALVVGVLVTGQSPALATTDLCISATLSEPVLLPDGSEHPGGILTLCLRGDYSPVASFHETYVDRMPVGLFLSHRCVSEGPAEAEPFMMFQREPDGRLRLYGYALPSGDHVAVYLLNQPRVGKVNYSLRAAAGASSCERPLWVS